MEYGFGAWGVAFGRFWECSTSHWLSGGGGEGNAEATLLFLLEAHVILRAVCLVHFLCSLVVRCVVVGDVC